jgi:hypothetical protein
MKSIKIKYLVAIFLAFVAVTACEEETENITGIIFDQNEGSTSSDVSLNIQIQYDTNGNRIANWSELIGLDVAVFNASSMAIQNVTVQIESITPVSVWNAYDDVPRTVGSIVSNGSRSPTYYWCYNCNTASEIRVGNFYVDIGSGSGTTTMSVVFRVDYTDGQGRNKIARQTFSTTVR